MTRLRKLRASGHHSGRLKNYDMALLTFQVLDGMERGLVLADLLPPVTIGREEDNAVQLNDELWRESG